MKKSTDGIRIFIVEDDLIYAKTLRYMMTLNPDHDVRVFSNGRDCINQMHLKPHIVSLDYTLPDMMGNEVFKEIKRLSPDTKVIVVSGQEDVGTAIEMYRQGVEEYITKEEASRNIIFNAIERIKKNILLSNEVATLRSELSDRYMFKNIIKGSSPKIKAVFDLLEKAIRTNITVSITGETGTGKELIAKSIHYNSKKNKGNFVPINVSAIPIDLLESELFGHEKGAFTGAITRKIGKFEMANNGTLFLDEIGEMDIHLQSKLLRALQEREITRVGGHETIPFNARIIVATHRNLAHLVAAGKFREDLYYRLLGLPIKLPALRERGMDILILAKHFLTETIQENKLSLVKLSQEAKDKLLNYKFPGNIRELKAIIELSTIMCNGKIIKREDLQFNSPRGLNNFLEHTMTLKEYNEKIITYYLDKHNNNIPEVAKVLNIGKTTIYRMLKSKKTVEIDN
jgi:DNA-binding NtrC family response regulator